jgi:hypothetical protein
MPLPEVLPSATPGMGSTMVDYLEVIDGSTPGD